MTKKKRAAGKAPRAARKPPPSIRESKRLSGGGSLVIYPRGVQQMLGISLPTRWRMEQQGRLPKRDFFVNGVAVGWRPATLEAAFAGKQAPEQSAA
jgi:predicted DNA-binding transcriptional regulator AlpA